MDSIEFSLEREVVPYDDINTLEEVDAALLKYRSTMSQHELMYKRADLNPLKGKLNGDCNVTKCQVPRANWWNNGTNAWYCEECANAINESARHSDFWPLCVTKEAHEGDITYVGDPSQLEPTINNKDEESESIAEFNNHLDSLNSDGYFNNITRATNPRKNKATGFKLGRNDPCPCGSGKKFKRCHL